ncbi:hypothetical protein LSH36_315g05031 [Paralvinella palmiformis]|uniref:Uncharacterized protein n=1 Tax=Paralvinella palmiformis TaxID=53620 RepID=A0AAD9N154_9ANNE|nr:hypothetical protein LSH36_315g05031 [Paralvinella palmiformis]
MIPSLKGLSYEERLRALNLPSLEHRRSRGDMLQVYKILNVSIEFNITNIDTSLTSYKEVYTKCLWQAKIRHYGGLLHVKFTGNKIEGQEYLAPLDPHIDQPLRSRLLLALHPNEDGKIVCTCYRGYQNHPHPAKVVKVVDVQDEVSFQYACTMEAYYAHYSYLDNPRMLHMSDYLTCEVTCCIQGIIELMFKHLVSSKQGYKLHMSDYLTSEVTCCIQGIIELMFKHLVSSKQGYKLHLSETVIEWLREETGEPNLNMADIHRREMALMKFMVLLEYQCNVQFAQLKLPQSPSYSVPIEPGIFKGTYGEHGIEMVLLQYTSDKYVEGIKVTGDPNVPAGKVTFRADLNRTMILNREQQNSLSLLHDIDTPDLAPDISMDKLPDQPFVVPYDCVERYKCSLTRCQYRCHSQGQIAGHGYTNSSFIPGHWIVFDENTFAHLWIDLSSMSVYSRVTEELAN